MADFDIELIKKLIEKTISNMQPATMATGTVVSINPPKIAIDNKNNLVIPEELFTITWGGKLTSEYLNKKVFMFRQDGGGHYYVFSGGYEYQKIGQTLYGNLGTTVNFDVPDRLKFMEQMIRLCVKYARNLKASVSIAQAMLESGLSPTNKGSGLALKYNNWFGIKAGSSWTGKVTTLSTQEDNGGGGLYTIQAGFRWYDSMEDSVKDHEAIFDSAWAKSHYARVLSATTAEAQCYGLQGTYATDTAYAGKLIRIINAYDLKKFDDLKPANATGANEKLEAMIAWFQSKLGKVSYSMAARGGPYSYDCSSAVFSAMKHAGIVPAGTPLGSTETLFGMRGRLLKEISRSEVRRGDIFVSGVPGYSSYAAGHTGVFIDNQRIIHCTYSKNGIAITPAAGWMGSPPHYYRLQI